jgi:hypothetical protein
MPEDEVSPEIARLLGRLEIDLCARHRPNWGWGSREPVPMFTEAEIRAACAAAKQDDQGTDDIIDALKVTRAHHIVEITP